MERTNPVAVQLLDEVAQTSLGELSQLPTGVLNSMLNYHRVEGLHATHVALVHHDRAITSRRICDDVQKEIVARAGFPDRKDNAPQPMDTQSGSVPPTSAPNEDVDIPDASDDEDSDSSHTGSVRTVTPKAGCTGYCSN